MSVCVWRVDLFQGFNRTVPQKMLFYSGLIVTGTLGRDGPFKENTLWSDSAVSNTEMLQMFNRLLIIMSRVCFDYVFAVCQAEVMKSVI